MLQSWWRHTNEHKLISTYADIRPTLSKQSTVSTDWMRYRGCTNWHVSQLSCWALCSWTLMSRKCESPGPDSPSRTGSHPEWSFRRTPSSRDGRAGAHTGWASTDCWFYICRCARKSHRSGDGWSASSKTTYCRLLRPLSCRNQTRS